jgi:hypothetical protein
MRLEARRVHVVSGPGGAPNLCPLVQKLDEKEDYNQVWDQELLKVLAEFLIHQLDLPGCRYNTLATDFELITASKRKINFLGNPFVH